MAVHNTCRQGDHRTGGSKLSKCNLQEELLECCVCALVVEEEAEEAGRVGKKSERGKATADEKTPSQWDNSTAGAKAHLWRECVNEYSLNACRQYCVCVRAKP